MLKWSMVARIFNPSTQDAERVIDFCEPARYTGISHVVAVTLKRIYCFACVLNLFKITIDMCEVIFVRLRVTNPQPTSVWKYMRLKDNTFSGTELNFFLNSFKDRKSKKKKFRSSRFPGLFACFAVLVYMCMNPYISVCVHTYVHMFVQVWM